MKCRFTQRRLSDYDQVLSNENSFFVRTITNLNELPPSIFDIDDCGIQDPPHTVQITVNKHINTQIFLSAPAPEHYTLNTPVHMILKMHILDDTTTFLLFRVLHQPTYYRYPLSI